MLKSDFFESWHEEYYYCCLLRKLPYRKPEILPSFALAVNSGLDRRGQLSVALIREVVTWFELDQLLPRVRAHGIQFSKYMWSQ